MPLSLAALSPSLGLDPGDVPAYKMGLMSSRLRLLVPPLVTLGFALTLLLMPLASSSTAPAIPHLDKLVHAALWLLLALTWWPLTARFPRRPFLAFLALVALGALTELLQALTPSRSADAWDLLADAVGAALGVAWSVRFCESRSLLKAPRHAEPRPNP